MSYSELALPFLRPFGSCNGIFGIHRSPGIKDVVTTLELEVAENEVQAKLEEDDDSNGRWRGTLNLVAQN